MGTYKEYIEDLKKEWIGKEVEFENEKHKVVDVDYNGALLIDKKAEHTDTTAIPIPQKDTKEISVTFRLTEDHEAALLELLPYWKNYEGKDGTKPFEEWKIEDVFKVAMETGSWHTIWNRIKEEQYREDLITVDELIDNKELTVAQRMKERQQDQKEGAAV